MNAAVVGNLSNILPQDVMLAILSRLPAKILAKFRCVAQSYNNLVRDQFFCNMHFNWFRTQNISFENRLILIHDSDNVYSSDYLHPDQVAKMEFPFSGSNVRIWGSCNGLVCIQSGLQDILSLYLWNPSTTEYRKIPCFKNSHKSVYGFGYNHRDEDYEVVHINRSTPCEVSVYSLRKNIWRKMSDIHYFFKRNASGVLVNGSLHWDALPLNITNFPFPYSVILAVEIGGDKLREVPMPIRYSIAGKNLASLQGKLCLLHSTNHPSNYVDVWVMNDYGVKDSWTVQFKFRKSIPGYSVSDLFLCLTEDGVVITRDRNASLILNDLNDGSCRLISYGQKILEVGTYSETLVGFLSHCHPSVKKPSCKQEVKDCLTERYKARLVRS